MKLYIVRHGKTDWNDLGILQGLTDIPLNEEGINGAKKLARKINIDDIDICICSPLKRAKETAQLIIENRKKIIYDDLLLERSFGSLEGKKINFDLIKRQWDYNLNDSSNGIESIKDCLNRSQKFLDKLSTEYPDKNILIVSHGCFIKALHFSIVGYDKDTDFLSFNPNNTEIYCYDYE